MNEASVVPNDLPGAEIVIEGLADLAAARESISALAVSMAATRLRAAGIDVPPTRSARPASHRLYEKLAGDDPRNAHSRFNAIVRRVASFARAAEHARAG
jgi:hypothetical protein